MSLITTESIMARGAEPAKPKAAPVLVKKVFPQDNQKALEDFYGKIEIGDDGLPTARWESSFLTTFDLPFRMRISWKRDEVIRKIRINRMLVGSLSNILESILHHFGSEDEIKKVGMDLFGGCYCYRRARGLGRLSVHCWGAAIDIDPDRNELGKKWKPETDMMSLEVVKIFESAGWQWGGQWNGRPDPMHFQATA